MTSGDWERVLGGTERAYMTEADVGTERDPPRPMIIQVNAMTIAQARSVPKALRAIGVTGGMVFTGGDVAERMGELAALRREVAALRGAHRAKGGDEDG